jgi:ComF family protein
MLKEALEWSLDILFPKRCCGCLAEGSFLCQACQAAIEIGPSVCFVCENRSPQGTICDLCKPATRLRRFIAPLSFRDHIVRELVHTLKYGGAKEIAALLAEYLTEYIRFYQIEIPPSALLVPIPLHQKRLRKRGFNQAELLAQAIGAGLNLPVETRLLFRAIYRNQQTKMKDKKARLANAIGVYQVRGIIPPQTTLILVDDVSTTGATLEEAARVLKKAGAKQVWAMTAARS